MSIKKDNYNKNKELFNKIFSLYEIANEPEFVDHQRLELHIGGKQWQSYLLPTGLPTHKKKRIMIIADKDIISNPKDLD